MSPPTEIEGNSGPENISNMWKNHYKDLFNCLRDSSLSTNTGDFVISDDYKNVVISCEEVASMILKLDSNKSCGIDGIQAEHIKFSSVKIIPLLAMCLTGCLVHGFLPDSLLTVVLVPIVKNKSESINSKSNYRPIALANICSKILERIILYRIETFILTTDNQFGFKKHHGTDMCIYSLKEIILKYNSLNSNVYTCFLDASKAFDRVNHRILINKLFKFNVPTYIIRIIYFWYGTQKMCVRWENVVSTFFNVTNGVRQGGILSPYLFCMYINDLSVELSKLNVGCITGDVTINHFIYADDIALISPSASGLNRLIKVCSDFGIKHDIKFNSTKSAILVFKSSLLKFCNYDNFELGNNKIPVVNNIKYLGHIISNDLKDTLDIERQRTKLYRQSNMIKRHFGSCTESVKIKLFRSYCESVYTAHLWWNYTNANYNRFIVAYNNSFRILVGEPKYCRASPMYVCRNVPSPKEVIRKLTISFLRRLASSLNIIVYNITNSDCRYLSDITLHMFTLTHCINSRELLGTRLSLYRSSWVGSLI